MTLKLEDFADSDRTIQAVLEQMEEKIRVVPALLPPAQTEALLLSNTSSLDMTYMV